MRAVSQLACNLPIRRMQMGRVSAVQLELNEEARTILRQQQSNKWWLGE
jgi:hypothetical protein